MTPPFGRLKSIFSSLWPSARSISLPCTNGRRWPYCSVRYPPFETVTLYRPAGSPLSSQRPSASVVTERGCGSICSGFSPGGPQ